MSRWFPDRLEFTLAPDRVVVGRRPHRLNLRAGSRTPAADDDVPVTFEGSAGPAWAGALATLQAVIGGLDADSVRHATATAILSNHFVRYALVDWSDLIDDDDEALSLSRHCLRQTYGAAADAWELRIAPERTGAQRLVSAVEPDLLTDLRDVFAGSPIRLVSIQPRLMAVCNRHASRLGSRDAWLALVEPGSLCLTLLHGGRIVRLRHVRLGAAWATELVTALDRESLVADAESTTRDVLVAAAGMPDQRFPPGLTWNIQSLEAGARPDTGPAGGSHLALAAGS